MQYVSLECPDRSPEIDLLVDDGVVESTCVTSEQSEFAFIAPVPESDEATAVGSPERQHESDGVGGIDGLDDRITKRLGDPLVTVERQDPVAGGQIECVILLGAESTPWHHVDVLGVSPGDVAGVVRTPGINHDDLVGEAHTSEAFLDVVGLVLRDDDDGQGHGGGRG